MEKQFVAFKVGNNCYCIDIMEVQEVVRENNVTHMPNFPAFVEGVINLRDTIVPIVSIHKKLYTSEKLPVKNKILTEEEFLNPSLESTQPKMIQENELIIEDLSNIDDELKNGVTYKLMVVKVGTIVIGLLVNSLDKILIAKDTDIQSAEGLGRSINHKMVSGILHCDDDIYIVLNSQGVLENEEEKLLNSRLQQ